MSVIYLTETYLKLRVICHIIDTLVSFCQTRLFTDLKWGSERGTQSTGSSHSRAEDKRAISPPRKCLSLLDVQSKVRTKPDDSQDKRLNYYVIFLRHIIYCCLVLPYWYKKQTRIYYNTIIKSGCNKKKERCSSAFNLRLLHALVLCSVLFFRHTSAGST